MVVKRQLSVLGINPPNIGGLQLEIGNISYSWDEISLHTNFDIPGLTRSGELAEATKQKVTKTISI